MKTLFQCVLKFCQTEAKNQQNGRKAESWIHQILPTKLVAEMTYWDCGDVWKTDKTLANTTRYRVELKILSVEKSVN